MESSLQERVIWPEPEGEGSLDILFGKGGKVSAGKIGEDGGEFVSIVKFNMTGTMSKH